MNLEGHSVSSSKRLLAKMTNGLAIDFLLLNTQRMWFRDGYIRAVNYHNMPRFTAKEFELHLRFYSENFSPVSFNDLHVFLNEKRWTKKKPGLIISFDDGLRCHYEVGASLIEKYGFTGWFFVPVGFVETLPSEQQAYASSHNIKFTPEYTDDRIAMNWNELRELGNKHVVGCHTRSHYRITGTESEEKLDTELVRPKHTFEHQLQQEIAAFSWVGGEETAYSPQAAACIEEANYQFSFGTSSAPILTRTHRLQLHRTNIESSWPIEIVKFQLSGLIDLRYRNKRRRVDKITAIDNHRVPSKA